MKILIIEDDPTVTETISIVIEMRWPEAKIINTGLGDTGVELVEKEEPDVVILDLGLPDISGFEVLNNIRLFSNVPVIILTVRGDEADVVKGLEQGADDYMIKPFRQLELSSRIQTLLRRSGSLDEQKPIVYEKMSYDPESNQLIFDGKEIALTKSEGQIFHSLINKAGRVVTQMELVEALYGTSYPEATDSIKVYIQRLRKKIEKDPGKPKVILTKAGIGYLLTQES
jgi:two-component system KDP operon response regulator KdpE